MSWLGNEREAEIFVAHLIWPTGPRCPFCSSERSTVLQRADSKVQLYKCRDCRRNYTVRRGTVFDHTHLQLSQWLEAMQVLADAPSVSAGDLAQRIGVSRRTAYRVLSSLREVIGNVSNAPQLEAHLSFNDIASAIRASWRAWFVEE
ncbi:transposase [Achromobacter denitrificans]|uniref:transposase n=1 Tax=Achromobacter denitrificans TaxID=32002 RepID=UPI003B975EF5